METNGFNINYIIIQCMPVTHSNSFSICLIYVFINSFIFLFLFFSVLENYPGETCPTGHSLFVTPFLGLPKRIVFGCLLFQVDIYPLKIHLTETMYRMMWEYFFPEEEQDSQRRQVGKNIQLKRIRLIQEYRSNF